MKVNIQCCPNGSTGRKEIKMILRIIEDELITVINVMMFEYKPGNTKIRIWDYGDNEATIEANNSIQASICTDKLFKNKEATIYGEINWDNNNGTDYEAPW